MARHALRLAVLFLVLSIGSSALAGGYDTPILYSARHIGMGGTAVGYVNDPSAIFHNPAGISGTKRWALLGDFSLVLGKVRATPNNPDFDPSARDAQSDTTVAPYFLVGGAYRFHKYVTAGLAVYPVASAGAEYTYQLRGNAYEDRTKLVFVEAAPAISFDIPGNVKLALAYRITRVSLDRYQGTKGGDPVLDFDMTGYDFAGFKVGVQYQPIPELKLGAMYRHKTVTKVENDQGIALFENYEDISTEFTLPSRFAFGARYDFGGIPLGIATDLEYALNSQNTSSPLRGTDQAGDKQSVPNVFDWTNALTVRVGFEYRLLNRRLPLRIGGAWDQKTANEQYPTAFGTPPGDTWIATLGAGWDAGDWQVNTAYALRTGTGEVTPADLAEGRNSSDRPCAFCGYAGDEDYKITMHGIYVDASCNFD